MDLDAVTHEPQEISLDAVVAETAQVSQPESSVEPGELDLSDEWAAISGEAQAEQPAAEAQELVAPLEFDPIVEPEKEAAHSAASGNNSRRRNHRGNPARGERSRGAT